MLRIMVAGGINEEDQENRPSLEEFARLLGKRLLVRDIFFSMHAGPALIF